MPCLLVALALATPRLVVLGLYFLTTWFATTVQPFAVLVLGFLFLPTTLLCYAAVRHWHGGVWGAWQLAALVVAVLVDAGPLKARR